MRSSRRSSITAAGAIGVITLVSAACGSSAGTAGSSGGPPAVIELHSVQELTGPTATFGVGAWDGEQLAVKNINSQQFLGKTKLSISVQNTGSTTTGAASAMQQAISSGDLVVIASSNTTDAQAEAPISARAGLPTVYLGSLATGITESGSTQYENNYLQVAPISSYDSWVGKYLQAHTIRTVAGIYDSDNAASVQAIPEALPQLAAKYGFKVNSINATATTSNDTASVVTKTLTSHPQAVDINVAGPQNATIVSELRDDGFTGLIIGGRGMNTQILAPAGAKANGIIWPTDFDASEGGAAAQQFVSQYEAAYNLPPNPLSAAGYDAVWLVARAIKEESTYTRSGLDAALNKVTSVGFSGVLGQLHYVNRVLQDPGLLVEYQDGKITAIPGYGG
jgi:branched-chain amino acid transport system substrate-binding protein